VRQTPTRQQRADTALRLTKLYAELTAATQWLAAELDTPTIDVTAEHVCRAIQKVAEFGLFAETAAQPGVGLRVHVAVVYSVALHLADVLRRREITPSETRECLRLAIETLSLASGLAFSLARHARPRAETVRLAAAAIARRVGWALVAWPSTGRRRQKHGRGDDHVLFARRLGRTGSRRRGRVNRPARQGHQHGVPWRP
jgi:hypothetical protein